MAGSPRIKKAAAIRIEHPTLTTEQAMLSAGFNKEETKCPKKQATVRQKCCRLNKEISKRKAESSGMNTVEEGRTRQPVRGGRRRKTKNPQPEYPQPSAVRASSNQNSPPEDPQPSAVRASSNQNPPPEDPQPSTMIDSSNQNPLPEYPQPSTIMASSNQNPLPEYPQPSSIMASSNQNPLPEYPQPSTAMISSNQNDDPLNHYNPELYHHEQDDAMKMYRQFRTDSSDFTSKQDTSSQQTHLSVKRSPNHDDCTQQTSLLQGLKSGQERITYRSDYKYQITIRKVNIVDQKVSSLFQNVGSLGHRVGNLEKKVGNLDKKLDKKVGNLENKVGNLEQKMDSLNQKMDSIVTLQQRILTKIEGSNIDTELSETDEEG